MAAGQAWKKAQSARLEQERAKEVNLRNQWFAAERAKWEEAEQKKQASEWKWGSSWWRQPQSHWSGTWVSQSGASSSVWRERPQEAEPTASSYEGCSPAEGSFPKRNPNEDKEALRSAALSPASFMPQRHVTMALGRPVMVS